MRHPLLTRWLLWGEWRAYPLRMLAAIIAIATGVALGFAIHLINSAAYNEFSAAVRSLSGQADLQVKASGAAFDEEWYPKLAQLQGVALASPVLNLDVDVPEREESLNVLGIDVFRAAQIAPDLIGVPAEDNRFDTLAADAIFLSPAAMEWLGTSQGETITLRAGTRLVTLRVAGTIIRARAGQRLGVMDIAAAQWHFDRLGQLSHVDLKLAEGIAREPFRQQLAAQLPPQLQITGTADQEARIANMSRAYRVNLNVLALVALFTGAFLVFSTQALSVIRRRQQLALLRVVGFQKKQVLGQILLEGGLLGVIGSVLGLTAGYLLAGLALRFFGGDLGGGYFPGVQPTLTFQPIAAAVFFLLGTGIAMAGSAAPAWEAARAKPAASLKAGSEDVALAKLSSPWPALACLAAGALLTQLPPVFELPIFGYIAVALLLIGGIALMPRLCAMLFSLAARFARKPVATLVMARLSNAPNQASIALGGVLSAFSLMVAMAIMVASFRVSVDDWLLRLLPADLYVRAVASSASTGMDASQQQMIRNIDGVARADFSRFTQVSLAPERPPIAIIARPIDVAAPDKALPLTGEILEADELPGDAYPAWVSEAMVDLYGARLGERFTLPIGKSKAEFVVAGVWRDYVRQTGAVQIRLSDYRDITGDATANDAALWLASGAGVQDVTAAVRALPFGDALEISTPDEIRSVSLDIFDRSFAVTYLLEGIAILIGLSGIAATFSAQTLARAKEFGMLRHIGLTRRQILSMLATEGALLTAIGIAVGFLLGWAISLILVFIVNPQSFHWTMELHMPWLLLGAVALALLLSAMGTALLSGRQAVSINAVQAVREDW
jgi:putative ABC transport system permease protein